MVCARVEFEWTLSSSFFTVHPVVSPSLFSRGRSLATRLPSLCRSPRSHHLPTDDRPFCLARPRSTLRPVIKQPRGGQIESVEETRERRRRGDGQLAATMVSIVKGPSRHSRVGIGARPKPNRMRDKMQGRGGGGESPGLRRLGERIHPGLEATHPTESPGRVRAMDRRPSRRPSTDVVA